MFYPKYILLLQSHEFKFIMSKYRKQYTVGIDKILPNKSWQYIKNKN